jgi:hypothetical protein
MSLIVGYIHDLTFQVFTCLLLAVGEQILGQ